MGSEGDRRRTPWDKYPVRGVYPLRRGRGAVTGRIAALGIVGVIAFLAGAILLVFASVGLATTRHTLDNGVSAIAEVVSVDKVTHHRSHPYAYRSYAAYVASVRFAIASGSTVTVKLAESEDESAYEVGQKMDIFYDSTDPHHVVPGGGVPGASLIVPTVGVVLSSLLTALGLGLLVGAVLGYRRNRRHGMDT